jgi:ribosomal protein L7/L12
MNESELHAEARRLKADGQLIAAIKLWRAATGQGLKESKDAVERL